MPDFDSGHIFLTTLAPIRDSAKDAHMHASFTQAARIALAKLPTAMQSPATEGIGINSPFARNRRTHLARMFVLNDIVYNGRVGRNAISASLADDDPSVIKPVDRLNTSYLVFCADIDAVEEDGAPLPKDLSPQQQHHVRASYAHLLWDTMEDELRDVYINCEGFEAVSSAQDFAEYLERCHVETTMPFHDYYLKLPEFNILPIRPLLAAVLLPLLFSLVGLVCRLFGAQHIPLIGTNSLLAFVGGLVVAAIAAFVSIKYAIRNGEKPLAPGAYDDLPSVLKALYLQQKFSDFAVDNQGATAQDLHDNFGAFLEQHKPHDRSGPTQPPGVIGAPGL